MNALKEWTIANALEIGSFRLLLRHNKMVEHFVVSSAV